jgi:hypothetical protein
MIDMLREKFLKQLTALPTYHRPGTSSDEVWQLPLPSWRMLFASVTTKAMARYTLPTHTDLIRVFRENIEAGYNTQHLLPHYKTPQMDFRISVLWEIGIAELYLYCCLKEALEHRRQIRNTIVLYDLYVDMQDKIDILVILKGQDITIHGIHAYRGPIPDRPPLETRRNHTDKQRRQRMEHNGVKFYWDDNITDSIPRFDITTQNGPLINNVRLFPIADINDLIRKLSTFMGIEDPYQFYENNY